MPNLSHGLSCQERTFDGPRQVGWLLDRMLFWGALTSAGEFLQRGDGLFLLESVVGEEDDGLGIFATLRRDYRGNAAIIPEPTNLAIIPACAGAFASFEGKLDEIAVYDRALTAEEIAEQYRVSQISFQSAAESRENGGDK